jgi:hypothetical protein
VHTLNVCVCVYLRVSFPMSEATSSLINDTELVPGLKFWIYDEQNHIRLDVWKVQVPI